MKLINLNLVNELLDNQHEGYELMVYTKQPNQSDYELSEFFELENIKNLKSLCARILKQMGNKVGCIDFKMNYEDTDFDQVTIYKN